MLPIFQLSRQGKIWHNYVKRFGFPSMSVVWKMWKLDSMRAYKGNKIDTNKRGHVFEYTLVFVTTAGFLYLFWAYTGLTAFLYVAILLIILSFKRLIRLARPPVVLYLAASTPESTELQLEIARRIYPLEVVSCTVHSEILFPDLINFYSYRTAKEAAWKEMVRSLISYSQMIVIDIREATSAVEFEIDLILKTVNTDKVFFVGSTVDDSRIPTFRCFTEKKLIKTLHETFRLSFRDKTVKNKHHAQELPAEDQKVHKKSEDSPIADVHPPRLKPKTSTERDALYRDKNGCFSFLPPKGWIRDDYPNDPRSKVQFRCPSMKGVEIRIIVQAGPPGLNSSNILDAVRAQMVDARSLFPTSVDFEITKGTFCGHIAAHIHWSLPTVVESEIIIFIIKGIIFNMSYGAPNKILFERYRNLALQSLDTLTFGEQVHSTNLLKKAQQHFVARRLRLAQLLVSVCDFESARETLEDALIHYPYDVDLKNAFKHVTEKKQIPEDFGPVASSK
jgi:hypothetical protein